MEISNKTFQLNSIAEAIEDIKDGKVVIVVDDEDRENEGDFVAAAEKATPEMINFMAKHGRGLICTPLTEKRCDELKLDMMVGHNTDPMETAFTISVDLNGNGVTTGISAKDRAITIQALTNKSTKPHDLRRPGHIFPLKAKLGGVLRRTGHTEAAIDLARLAGLEPAGVIVEIMNEDGTMARLPQLFEIAQKFNLKVISIEDLVAYRMQHDSLIQKIEDFEVHTRFGNFQLIAYKQNTNKLVHIVLKKGSWKVGEEVLVRVNSTLINNDIIGTLTTNPDKKLKNVFEKINEEGKGVVVFINQENNSLNLEERLATLREQQNIEEQTSIRLRMDEKDYGIGAQIIHDLGIEKLRVLSNSTHNRKRVGMTGYNLEIVEYVNY